MNDIEPEPLHNLPETNRGGEFFSQPGPYRLNDTAKLLCGPSDSFKPLSNDISTVILKDDGTLAWDPPRINCEPISELTELPKTQHLNKFECDEKPPYLYDDKARLICNKDYGYKDPVITFSTVVLRNGQLVWYPSEINCIPPACQQPNIILNGRPDNRNFTFGQSFSYECDPGYKINKHMNKFFCNFNHKWYPEIPDDIACEAIKCPPLKQPINGFLQYTDNTFNSVARFACEDNYTMIKGDQLRYCLSDGTWSGEEVICAQLPCPPMDPSVKVVIPLTDNNLTLIDCGNSKTLWVKCFSTGWWQYEHPYCDRKPEKNRVRINPDSLASYNLMLSKLPPPSSNPTSIPNVSTSIPVSKPNVTSASPTVSIPDPKISIPVPKPHPRATHNIPSAPQPSNRTKNLNFYGLLWILLILFTILSVLSWLLFRK